MSQRVAASAAPAPAGGTTSGPAADETAAGVRRRRSRWVLGSIVAVVLVLGVAGLVAGETGDDPARADVSAGDGPTVTRPTTTTTAPPLNAAAAFGAAGRRLTTAGSFGYRGTVSATDVSDVRPSLWLAVEVVVEGEVSTSTGRLHEVAVAASGSAAETLTDGPRVWGRRAPAVDGLADETYEAVPALSDGGEPATGAARLPTWLAAARDAGEAGVDELGRRTFGATIAADVLGEIERGRRPVDAAIVLTVDDAGDPVRVEITSAPQGPALHLVYEISDLGEPLTIVPPV